MDPEGCSEEEMASACFFRSLCSSTYLDGVHCTGSLHLLSSMMNAHSPSSNARFLAARYACSALAFFLSTALLLHSSSGHQDG